MNKAFAETILNAMREDKESASVQGMEPRVEFDEDGMISVKGLAKVAQLVYLANDLRDSIPAVQAYEHKAGRNVFALLITREKAEVIHTALGVFIDAATQDVEFYHRHKEESMGEYNEGYLEGYRSGKMNATRVAPEEQGEDTVGDYGYAGGPRNAAINEMDKQPNVVDLSSGMYQHDHNTDALKENDDA